MSPSQVQFPIAETTEQQEAQRNPDPGRFPDQVAEPGDYSIVTLAGLFDFVDGYGDLVFIIEYQRPAFDQGCADFPNLSIVYRDLDLVTPYIETVMNPPFLESWISGLFVEKTLKC